MGANIAGIYGAQIFREDDRPRYRRAFSVNCAVLAIGLALAALRYFNDVIHRRRNVRRFSGAPASRRPSEKLDREKNALVAPPSDDQPGPIVLEAGHRLSCS